ncbi:MAG: FHA domain-containing protein [Actinomycetota bacterium]|nr:FHA domain-containing protein [Actinomycetota bacterium]
MSRHTSSPQELQARLRLEARGQPFLVLRDATGVQALVELDGRVAATVGRGPRVDVALDEDPEVSRLHAELRSLGGAWVVDDDGLSQNGSFVGGERVVGRRRLRDGDVLRFGGTDVVFRDPGEAALRETRAALEQPRPELSPTQRKVLVALCRPFRDGGAYARPAANREIADELFLSVEAIKDHLRALFAKLGLEEFPPNEKRLRLVERALDTGLLSAHEL